jgi:hypothetical protein
MKQFFLVGLLALVTCAVALPRAALAHDRKEVAGLVVIFGAEPEPALTGERQWLRWRFRFGDEPFGELQDATAVVRRDGKEYGPFEARPARREPGLVQTVHIFSAAGDYEVVLTFRKKGDPKVHSVAFSYRIRDRRELQIPN